MKENIRILQFSNGERNAYVSVSKRMRSMSLVVIVCYIAENKMAIFRYKLRARKKALYNRNIASFNFH